MEPSGSHSQRRKSLIVKPPKEYASLRAVGIRNARTKRKRIQPRVKPDRQPVTSGSSQDQTACSTSMAVHSSASSDMTSAVLQNTHSEDIASKRSSAQLWESISKAQIDAFAGQLWSSSEFASLCHECWQEITDEFHDCIWQLRAKPDMATYGIKTSSNSMVLELNLPKQHMASCDKSHSLVCMCVFDQKARVRQCCVQTCDGEPVAVSLVRHGLWPATPSQPVKAVHISLMEQLYELVVGSSFSLFRSCQALQAFGRLHTEKTATTNLYSVVNRFLSFRFYRRFHQGIFDLRDVIGNPSFAPDCDACPRTDGEGELYICMDASFGLVHKLKSQKKSSESNAANEENTHFMCSQPEVQAFVQASYRDLHNTSETPTSVDCSSFSAGDSVVAATKNRGLSVKGVFGACCRHQQPLKLLDMVHGERFSYPSFILRQLCSPNAKATVLYDVACKFSKYFSRTEPAISANLTFKVPVFHSYAHSVACQLLYNPRISGTCGLTDGEGQERMWSMLQLSSKCMKEMTAANRISFLDDKLHDYAAKVNASMHCWIKRRLSFAKRVELESQEKLDELIRVIDPPTAASSQCEEWLTEISALLSTTRRTNLKQIDWHRTYVATLGRLELLRNRIKGETNPSELTRIQSEENGLLSSVAEIEHKHAISERWQCDDILFLTVQDQLRMEHVLPILQAMFKAAAELRQFLDLMKKFCPGQDAFNRMKRLVKQCRRSLTSNLNKYNVAEKPQSPQLPDTLEEAAVFDPDSSQWAYLQLVTESDKIDPSVCLKLAAIQAYGQIKSAKMEQQLLKVDSNNVLRRLHQRIDLLLLLTEGTAVKDVKHPLYVSHLNALKCRLQEAQLQCPPSFTQIVDPHVKETAIHSSDSDSEYEY